MAGPNRKPLWSQWFVEKGVNVSLFVFVFKCMALSTILSYDKKVIRYKSLNSPR